jgi:hypothetical protein
VPHIPIVRAVAFHQELATGSTGPCILSCEDMDGEPAGEYVVKFRTKVRGGPTGLLFECVAAQLAIRLGLHTPSPAIVLLDPALADATPDQRVSGKIRENLGVNYGCCFLAGYNTWYVDGPVPLSLRQAACEIMAFDALIDNGDRRREKPNLLWKGEEIFVIDHELAFSFVRLIGDTPAPFDYHSLGFLRKHPLYAGLRRRPIDLGRMTGELQSLDETTLNLLFDAAPAEFGRAYQERIVAWLMSAAGRTQLLVESLGRMLS